MILLFLIYIWTGLRHYINVNYWFLLKACCIQRFVEPTKYVDKRQSHVWFNFVLTGVAISANNFV